MGMKSILLDTSAYSAFMRGNESVKKWVQESEDIFINPIIIGELKAGFTKGSKKEKNFQELERFILSPRVRIIAIDEDTSDRYAVILNSLWQAGTPIPTNDIWIAASAMQYGLKLVTTDKHFSFVSQVIIECIVN